jgi:hypothetical protein
MSCCDYGCNQGANCPIRKTPIYKPNSEYIGRESDDVPPMGGFTDFFEYTRTTIIPWAVGVALGILSTIIYFLLG